MKKVNSIDKIIYAEKLCGDKPNQWLRRRLRGLVRKAYDLGIDLGHCNSMDVRAMNEINDEFKDVFGFKA